MPVSAGKCFSNCAKASSPPADAPMPTIGKAETEALDDESEDAWNFSTGGLDDLARAADFRFCRVSLPRDSLRCFFIHPNSNPCCAFTARSVLGERGLYLHNGRE